jgi:hypothetical protein
LQWIDKLDFMFNSITRVLGTGTMTVYGTI